MTSLCLIFLRVDNVLLILIAICLILNLNRSHLLRKYISNSPTSVTSCLTTVQNSASSKRVLLNFHMEFMLFSLPPGESVKYITQLSVRGYAEISHPITSLTKLSEINQ